MTLTVSDVARLEAAGHRNFCRENRDGDLQLLNLSGRCVFLEDGICRAYVDRPDGCRFYPLVFDLENDREEVDAFCPHGDDFSFSREDAAALRTSVAIEERESTARRVARRALVITLLIFAASSVSAEPVEKRDPLPWEVWRDLTLIGEIHHEDRVLMRSSHCPDGCPRDRHSAGESRFIHEIGDEGVVFEDTGPGAITRIWMTQGENGVSAPLDSDIWIRIVVDGVTVVQLPLPEFFDSGVPPFEAPLVLDREQSGGGNISYVPIPYSSSCRVSLLGAADAKIWFQVTYHELGDDSTVAPFTGEEDLSRWRDLLNQAGRDPWGEDAGTVASGKTTLRRGSRVVIGGYSGPDLLTGLMLRISEHDCTDVNIRLIFDGEVRVDMPVKDFFAVGRDPSFPTRSLLIGSEQGSQFYVYFPMPFFESALVQLSRDGHGGRRKVPVEYAIRRRGLPPTNRSGLFGAERMEIDQSRPGHEVEVLRLAGRGKWVGVFAEIGSVLSGSRDYFEGDERIYLDDADEPQLHGTGLEDFFGGGFYFRIDGESPVRFRNALYGMIFDHTDKAGRSLTGMYRLMLTDAPTWSRGIRVTFEGGPSNQTPVSARTVAYYYSASQDEPQADLPPATRDSMKE